MGYNRWFLHGLIPIVASLLVTMSGQAAIHNVSGPISSNTTWGPAGDVHIVDADVTVPAGVTLTIQQGVVVKFEYVALSGTWYKRKMVVNGELLAEEKAASPIVFTSIRDDGHGSDSNGDGTTEADIAGNAMSTGNGSGIAERPL